jgi:prevent-host-death family protein
VGETEQLPLSEVKKSLSALVGRLAREHARVVITKHGRPAAIMLSMDDLASLEATIAVLGNRMVMEDIRESYAEIASRNTEVLTREAVLWLIPPT